MVDADEVVEPALAAEVRQITARGDDIAVEGSVHEKPVFNGDYALLDGALEHHPFTKAWRTG